MRSFEEVSNELKNSCDVDLSVLEKELKEKLNTLYSSSLDSSKFAEFKEEYNLLTDQIKQLRLKREVNTFNLFKKELKATYLPESSEELSDLFYEQALLHTKVMDDITKNYESLINFHNNIKKLEQKGEH